VVSAHPSVQWIKPPFKARQPLLKNMTHIEKQIYTKGSRVLQAANLWPLSTRRGVLLGDLCEDNDSGSSISSSMVAERISRSEGDESTIYVVSDDATANILSAI
jgi:hypothetical protein